MKEYKYECINCSGIFKKKYKKKKSKTGLCFCSNACRGEYQQKQRTLGVCTNCKKPTILNWERRQHKKVFCCKQCYWCYKKETGYGSNSESLSNARKKSNSIDAIKKRRITNINNGIWLPDDKIVNGMTFKQYKRKVYRITKNKKQDLLQEWSGVDYYDKEYIGDNFNLSPQDGDYPSIDHITGVQQGFKQGISPIDLCIDDNLVWTKRRINSSKRQYNLPKNLKGEI